MTDKTTDTAKEANSAEAEEHIIIDDTIITTGSLARNLKKCREAADMDLRQAADEMRLPIRVLKALEAEEFDDLPEPPYVRGYLRSYARLNESDPNDLIRRYETLRGADDEPLAAFAPTATTRHLTTSNRGAAARGASTYRSGAATAAANSKPSVSPATVKLAGLALMVLVLGVLSMIPAVSQWASDTWRSFSEPNAEQQLANMDGNSTQDGNSMTATPDDSTGQNSSQTVVSNSSSDTTRSDTTNGGTASGNDTATSSDNEQLALNNQDSSSGDAAPSQNDSSATAATNTNDGDNGGNTNTAAGQSADGQSDQQDNSQNSSTDNNTAGSSDNSSSDDNSDGDSGAQNAAGQTSATDTTQNADTGSTEQHTDDTSAEALLAKAEEAAAAEKAEIERLAAAKKAEEEAAKKAEEEAKLAEQQQAEAAAAAAEDEKKLAAEEAAKKAEEQRKKKEQASAGNVDIQLVFNQSVWMSIKDKKGKNIFAELNRPGARKRLTARAPLNFRIGNAPGVKIYLNGQLIDQKPYTRGSVSQFVVN